MVFHQVVNRGSPVRLRVVSNFGEGDCGAGEIHTRARKFEATSRGDVAFPSRRVFLNFRARVCISPAPQSPSPKLEATRSLVPSRFFGMRDLTYSKGGIRDFGKKMGSEIRDCNFDRDRGFGDFWKRDSGNVNLKSRDSGNLRRKSSCHLVGMSEIGQEMYPRPNHAAIATPMAIFCLFS